MLFNQIGRFASVGVINTIIDVSLFNLLAGRHFGWGKIRANLVSTTCAMTFSFIANRQFVFNSGHGNPLLQAAWFLGVTAFGLYGLQNLVIYILTEVWTAPVNLAVRLTKLLGLSGLLKKDLVIRNSAKAAAIATSLVWNFVMYKRVVFR
jgi:putative flippase GtrA